MSNRLVMSLKGTTDHLFQLVYSPSPQTTIGFNKYTSYWSWATRQHRHLSYAHSTRFITTMHAKQKRRETNISVCAHTHTQTNAPPHTHKEKVKFKYPMISRHYAPHINAHSSPIFPLTLICLCSNIRGFGNVWGGVCLLISPPIPLRSGLRQTVCCADIELTHMPPHCRPPAQTECVALRRPLEIFSEMMEDSGTNAEPAGKKI